MTTDLLFVWRVVIRDDDRVVRHSNVAFQSEEEVLGQVIGIPAIEGATQSRAQLMDGCLGNQGHGHLPIADVEIHRTGAFPTKGLIGVEELFDMPSFGEVDCQRIDFISVGGAQEAFVLPGVGTFTVALDELPIAACFAGLDFERQFRGSETSPTADELILRDCLESSPMGRLIRDRNEQIEACASVDVGDQFTGEVFRVGNDERLPGCWVQDALGQVDQFRCGCDNAARCRGGGETDGLMRIGIEYPEGLRHLGWLGSGILDAFAHVTFAVTACAVGINSQQSGLKISRGTTHSAQGNLQANAFGDRVFVEQVVNGRIRRDERQTVGQFESTARVQRAVGANPARADGRLVNQLQSQTRFDAFARLPGPAAQKVPGSEPEMFGHQQPDAGEVAGDFVGKSLSHRAFEAERITGLVFGSFATDSGLDLGGFMTGTTLIKFFFEGRIRR